MRTLLLRWVTSCRWPMFIVGDPEFLDIIQMLNPQAVTPSRNTVTQDIKTMYSMTKTNLKNILQASIQFHCSPITILTEISEEYKGSGAHCTRCVDGHQHDCVDWCYTLYGEGGRLQENPFGFHLVRFSPSASKL
jgi:hypothetical protein